MFVCILNVGMLRFFFIFIFNKTYFHEVTELLDCDTECLEKKKYPP